MEGRRLNLWLWLLAWAALVALQGFVVSKGIGDLTELSVPLEFPDRIPLEEANPAAWSGELVLALIILIQALKAPLAAARLRDLGRPPDDAVLTLVPLANFGLWYQLFALTPRPEVREKRLATWSGQLQASAAVKQALGLLVRGAPAFLGLALVAGLAYAGVHFVGLEIYEGLVAASEETARLARDGLFAFSGFMGLALLIQVGKRKTASRGSWIPLLFLLPSLLLAFAIEFRAARDQEVIVLSFVFTALQLLWGSFLAAFLAIFWLSIGDSLQRDERLSSSGAFAGALSVLKERWSDMVAVHGGVYQAVMLGIQVIIPGVHYAVVYALADVCVLFEPDQPSFRRSANLTAGIRRRVFDVQVMGLLPYAYGSLFAGLATVGMAEMVASLFDPRTTSAWSEIVLGPLWMLTVAVIKLSLLQIWRDRTNAR